MWKIYKASKENKLFECKTWGNKKKLSTETKKSYKKNLVNIPEDN